MDPMEAIKITFFQECDEQLLELEAGLLAINDGSRDPEIVNAVFRCVHSIKGGAGAFGLETLVTFAHAFETLLDKLRANALEPTEEITSLLLRAADILTDLVGSAREGSEPDGRWTELLSDLQGYSSETATQYFHKAASEDPSSEPQQAVGTEADFTPLPISFGGEAEVSGDLADPSKYSVRFKPYARVFQNGNDVALLLRELGELGPLTLACDLTDVPPLDAIDPTASYLSWTAELTTESGEAAIHEVFEFVADDCDLIIERLTPELPTPLSQAVEINDLSEADTAEEISNLQTAAQHQDTTIVAPTTNEREKASVGGPATIRVDLDRVDRLIDLVGELVITQAMLAQRVMDAGITNAAAIGLGLEDLEHLIHEIQDGVMAIRAQPVRSLFQRMSRIVRETAHATQKKVRLTTEGETTEIDKTVIERLADPLTHMIRNAIDHGIEAPESRVDSGKPPEGTVRLSAAHRSGRVIIEVSDDGAGINRKRVREIAIKKGLIADGLELTDAETDNLLFLPGFSTTSSVSNLSGRGVGMDVVKRSIQMLGGRIAISSTPGIGTKFSMSLPLTLAVLDGMVVTAADQTLVIPLTTVVETLRPAETDVHRLAGGGHVIAIRGGFVPLIDLAAELGFRRGSFMPSQGVAILVETETAERLALLVNAIQDQRQVVIKSLENNYGKISGIAAATILGDGRVALIVDVDAIVTKEVIQAEVIEPSFTVSGDCYA